MGPACASLQSNALKFTDDNGRLDVLAALEEVPAAAEEPDREEEEPQEAGGVESGRAPYRLVLQVRRRAQPFAEFVH